MSPYKGADRAVEIAKEVGENLIVAGMDENVESRNYVFKVMKKRMKMVSPTLERSAWKRS